MQPISREDLIKRLRAFDYIGPKSGGRHSFMIKGEHKLIIPNKHKRKDITEPLLSKILNQAGISKKEWDNITQKPLREKP